MMGGFEIAILIVLFIASLALIYLNFDLALTVLLVLSVLLHKEFFSIYRWDLLPIRVFMFAFLIVSIWKVILWWKKEGSLIKVKEFILEPFNLLLILMWFVSGISIIFSKNLLDSIFLFGFFTTITSLGLTLYQRLKDNPDRIIKLIKTYLFIIFGLTIFGFIQLAVYLKTEFIFGALWNVPGRLPRIGATFWDVNHFGALLAGTLPVLGMFILTEKPWKKKIIYSLMFVPMVTMMFLTNSRSAWLLALFAFIAFIMIRLIKKYSFKAVYVVLGILIFISAMGFIEYSDKQSPFRAKIKDYFHYRIDSFDSHLYLLQGAYQVLEQHPVLGGGYGSFFEQFEETEISSTYFGRDPISITSGTGVNAHSIWGEAAAETGWVGLSALTLFTLLVVSTLIYAGLKHDDNRKSIIASGMAASLIGWFIAGIFYSYKAEFFYLILFLFFLYGFGISKNYGIKKLLSFFTKNDRLFIFIFIILSSTLILFGLGKNHLIPWDEAIYAKIAKNMAEFGRYGVMRWDITKVWYEKPPLYMWLSALSMKLLGVSEFSARLPSALLGIGTVLVVYSFGKKLFNKTTGYIAALALVTTTQFIYYSRTAMLDVSTTFFITIALYFYWKTVENRDNWKNWLYSGIAIGLAAMIKNVVGFLPFLIIGLFELYQIIFEKKKFLFKKYLIIILASLAVFLPWHIYMYIMFGQKFIDNYVLYHIVERATVAIEDKGRPFFWYFIVVKVSMRIWFVALLGALPFTIFKSFFKKNKKHIFLFIYFISIFLFFSSAKSKLVWYIMPLYPAAALIVGRFSEQILDFAMQKVKGLDNVVFKALVLFVVSSFSVFYVFSVKELVYPPDLTGAQAELLKLKETKYGISEVIYVNKVSLPVTMFYLDGPFKIVEYSGLEKKLDNAEYNESVVYVTKESRQERIETEFPKAILIQNLSDHSLGFLDSEYSFDTAQVERLNNQIGKLQDKIEKGTPLTLDESQRLSGLLIQKSTLETKISQSLAEVGK